MTSVYEEYDALYRYFGGYLHQDWMYQFSHPDDAYTSFLEHLDSPGVSTLIEQTDRLLGLPEGERADVMRVLNQDVDPEADFGWDEREWLQSLRDRAAQELLARAPGKDR